MLKLHPQFLIDSNEKRTAVVVPIEEWQSLMDELEDRDDLRAYEAAKAEGGEAIPFDQAVKEIESGKIL